jgi:hypothetical protein
MLEVADMRILQGLAIVVLAIIGTLIGVAGATRGIEGSTWFVMPLCFAGTVGVAWLPTSGRRVGA